MGRIISQREYDYRLDQALRALFRYRYLYTSKRDIKEIPILQRDIDATKIIIDAILKKSTIALYYPVPEATYNVINFLAPLSHVFVGEHAFPNISLISAVPNISELYSSICDKDGQKLAILHKSIKVEKVGQESIDYKSTHTIHRIAFSRNFDTGLQYFPHKVNSVVLDLNSFPLRAISHENIKKIIEDLKQKCDSLIILFNPLMEGIWRIFDNLKITIATIDRESERYSPDNFHETIKSNTQTKSDKPFLKKYLTWAFKIENSTCFPSLSMINLNGPYVLSEVNKALSETWVQIKKTTGSDDYMYPFRIALNLENTMRCLSVRIEDYDHKSLEVYGAKPILQRLSNFENVVRQISDRDPILGTKFSHLNDNFKVAFTQLKNNSTEKIRFSQESLASNGNNSILLASNTQEKLAFMDNFDFDHVENKENKKIVVTMKELLRLPKVETLLVPGIYSWSESFLKFTSSANSIKIMCYPWEVNKFHRMRSLNNSNYAKWFKLTKGEKEFVQIPFQQDLSEEFRDHFLSRVSEKDGIGNTSFTPANIFSFFPLSQEEDQRVAEFKENTTDRMVIVKTLKGNIHVSEFRSFTVVRKNSAEDILASKLKENDEILVGKDLNPRPISDFVWDLLSQYIDVDENALWRRWKQKLLEISNNIEGNPYEQIFKRLKELGSPILTPQAVYAWLTSENLIGPRQKRTFDAISEIIGIEKSERDVWWASIKQVRSTLASLYKNVWKLARSYSNEVKDYNTDDIVLNSSLGITLSDIGTLMEVTKVESVYYEGDDYAK